MFYSSSATPRARAFFADDFIEARIEQGVVNVLGERRMVEHPFLELPVIAVGQGSLSLLDGGFDGSELFVSHGFLCAPRAVGGCSLRGPRRAPQLLTAGVGTPIVPLHPRSGVIRGS
jgi:hypothetical protein